MILTLSIVLGFQLNAQTIHELSYKNIDGQEVAMNNYKGKKILIVNVASECGFTSQYEGLQKLSSKYSDKLTVIGFPSNEFGGQEPGNELQIKTFCKEKYQVSFPMASKILVKNVDGQHPIYQWLTRKEKNRVKSSSVKWNFQKYLIDETGHLIDYFYSTTAPLDEDITSKI